MVKQTLGVTLPAGRKVQPEDNEPGATICNYGSRLGDPEMIVYAFRQRADSYFVKAEKASRSHGAALNDISGPGYKGYSYSQPYDNMPAQIFTIVKNGQYINPLLSYFPPGSADKLAAEVARSLP